MRGIAPGVRIVSLKALNEDGSGSDSSVIAAINRAIQLKDLYKIRVINMSLGRPITGDFPEGSAVPGRRGRVARRAWS